MLFRIHALLFTTIFLASACTPVQKDGPPKYSFNADTVSDPVPIPLKKSLYGNPHSYVIKGKRYFVADSAQGYDRQGIASWYGTKFHGQLTSSGEPYNMFKLSAASRTLPIPTFAKVTNLENGRSIIVKVNDRGPFVKNRLIDLSYAAAKKLHFAQKGTAFVEVKTITFKNKHLENKKFPNQKLYLQVAIFKNFKNAIALKSYLKKTINDPVRINPITSTTKKLFRVEVGPLAEPEKSAKLSRLLNDLGLGHPIALMI